DDIADVFKETPPNNTIHIVIQSPSTLQSVPDSELTDFRKQVADVQGPTILVGVVVKSATLDDKKRILREYPRYGHEGYPEVFAYHTQRELERTREDEGLRGILKDVQRLSNPCLTISLATQAKSFASWAFNDVCEEYELSGSSDPIIQKLRPFYEDSLDGVGFRHSKVDRGSTYSRDRTQGGCT
ncbi:hypothetical protein BGX21_008375, partial [Mortierella sp. AD011]